MVVFYQQPNYERFQVASDECTISRKTDSLYRRKLREQSMLHVKRVRVELRIPEGYRCEEGLRSGSRLKFVVERIRKRDMGAAFPHCRADRTERTDSNSRDPVRQAYTCVLSSYAPSSQRYPLRNP